MVDKLEPVRIYGVCCGLDKLETVRIFRVCCGQQVRTPSYLLGFVVVDRLEPVRFFGGSLWSRQARNSSYVWGLWSTSVKQFVSLRVCCGRQARTRSYVWGFVWGFVVVERLEPVCIFEGLLWSKSSNPFVSKGFVVVDKV